MYVIYSYTFRSLFQKIKELQVQKTVKSSRARNPRKVVGQYSYPAGYSKFTGGGIRELGQT
jgi:hypothetical protein